MSRPGSRRALRVIRLSLVGRSGRQDPDGSADAPSTGRDRWLNDRFVVEPELLRLDYELGMEDGHGLRGITLIWVHADPRSSGVTAISTTTLPN